VVITPHNAFNTREAIQRILATTVDNIDAYVQGEPQNIVR
jgi:D-lactate dehydrogenase